MNLKKKNNYKRIKNLLNISDVERFINRSVGYFNAVIANGNGTIHKGHIEQYFFILQDMKQNEELQYPKITYNGKNKTILKYGLTILKLRYLEHNSMTTISEILRTKYKRKLSRTTIFNFLSENKKEWESYGKS